MTTGAISITHFMNLHTPSSKCKMEIRVGSRGVRVYPYLRVYPTQPIPADTGRVDVSRVGSGGYDVHGYGCTRFYPYGTRLFTILEREPFYFCMFSKLLMMKQLQYGT